MSRTRRVLTRTGDPDFTTGEDWGTQHNAILGPADFVVVDLASDPNPDFRFAMDFGGAAPITRVVIWRNGFLSLGDVTDAQIAWAASHDFNADIAGFPGDFIAAGFMDTDTAVEYTFGEVDFDPPFNRAEAPPILRITWRNHDFVSFQIQLGPSDFTMVDASLSDPSANPGTVAFRVGGYLFDAAMQPMPEYFFVNGLGGAFFGTGFANVIGGTVRDDTIDGMAGFDHLLGKEGLDRLTGGDGNDLLDGGTGPDRMNGGAGNDTFIVDEAGDIVFEAVGGGTDTVLSAVTYTLAANVESLTLSGVEANNGYGNTLANVMRGNAAANLLAGGAGNDAINGFGGADQMLGGAGNDVYYVDNAGDEVVESAGFGADRIFSSVSYTIRTNVETITLTGTAAINSNGNSGANSLIGNGAANVLNGKNGNDIVDGGGGNDSLFGSAGNDTLIGGTGTDRFYFDSALSAATNVDQILDFVVPSDRIYLARAIFAGIVANGTLDPAAFHAGAAAADTSDRIIYNPGTGDILYDSDGTGAAAAVLFARVTAGTTLTNLDFIAY